MTEVSTISVGEHQGLTYAVVSNGIGYLCGYVLCERGTALYGEDYNSKILKRVSVHGGLTFADKTTFSNREGWWLGFDCAHAGDGFSEEYCDDSYLESLRGSAMTYLRRMGGGPVKDVQYVTNECKSLAEQIKPLLGV